MSGSCSQCCGCFLAMLLLASCSRAPENGIPPLPRVILTNFRPQIRDRLQQAYRELESHPADPALNGRLAMLFHAFEQYDSAETCYRRTRALAPREFRWAYYLGLVQTINGKNEAAAATLREATTLDSNYLPARMKLAEVLLMLRRLDESAEVSRSIASGRPAVRACVLLAGAGGRRPGATGRIGGTVSEGLPVVAELRNRALRPCAGQPPDGRRGCRPAGDGAV